MSEHYRQPIALFGFILPTVVMTILAGGMLFYTSSVNNEFASKKRAYEVSQEAKRQIMKLRGEVETNKPKMDAWDKLLRTETRGTFLEHWKNAAKNFNGKELTKSSRSWINYSEGLGRGVSQPSSQVIMSFVGTYRAMQTALMELETALPTMQLDALECITITQDIDTEVYPLAENETFSALRDEAWYIQDFLSADQNEIDMYPDRADMKILKFGRRIKKMVAVLFMGIVFYAGYTVSTKVKSAVWSHQPTDDKAEKNVLTNELKTYEHWNNLLMDRSKAWVCLELVARMIPVDGSVILKTVKHDVQPKKESNSAKSGFSKEWVITGFASELGIEHLEKHCTSDGINKLFLDVALSTENAAYLPEAGHRDITVSLVPRFNPSFNRFNSQNAGSSFERVFTLTISQNVTADDEMALSTVEGVNN